MTENFEPVATPPAASENVVAPPASAQVTALARKKAGLWAGVLAAVLLAGAGGFAIGSHGGSGDRIDRVSFNGPMMGGDDQLGKGQGMQPGQGVPGPGMPGQGMGKGKQRGPGFGPHCENTAGDHKPVSADGTCPTGYTLDNGRGRGANQPQPGASPSSSTL